jgi:hypothetical protein
MMNMAAAALLRFQNSRVELRHRSRSSAASRYSTCTVTGTVTGPLSAVYSDDNPDSESADRRPLINAVGMLGLGSCLTRILIRDYRLGSCLILTRDYRDRLAA